MYGAGGQKRVPDEFVRNYACTLPPIHEQSAISDFLKVRTQQLDSLKKESTDVIDLLKERRSALIAAAVTGQIDVRGAVEAQAA